MTEAIETGHESIRNIFQAIVQMHFDFSHGGDGVHVSEDRKSVVIPLTKGYTGNEEFLSLLADANIGVADSAFAPDGNAGRGVRYVRIPLEQTELFENAAGLYKKMVCDAVERQIGEAVKVLGNGEEASHLIRRVGDRVREAGRSCIPRGVFAGD